MEGEGRERPRHPALRRGRWLDAYREFLRPRTIVVGALFVTLFVGALTILGPLGTLATMPPLRRLLYFGSTAVVMFPPCYGMAAAVLYVSRFASLLAIAPVAAGSALVQVLACTSAVHAADTIFRPDQARPSLGTVFVTILPVLAMCTLFVHYIVFQRVATDRSDAGARSPEPAGDERATDAVHGGPGDAAGLSREGRAAPPKTAQPTGPPRAAEPKSPPTPDPERFYRRLSQSVSRDIIYLEMDDHYVDVHTTDGSCIVSMRFTDAIALLGDLGLQTHRSYWVARRHVIRAEQRDGRTVVLLTGGHRAPVSRSRLLEVRDALRRPDGAEPRAPASGDGPPG